MIVYYDKHYNIDLGLLNKLHPFDGLKFKKVAAQIESLPGIQFVSPQGPISETSINSFVDVLVQRWLHKKRYILGALELPYIPLVPFTLIDNRLLLPMRWGVKGTLEAAKKALEGHNCWNLAGGYHHASQAGAEGFCVYNDVGIAVQQLRTARLIQPEDKVLIIDIDAHHGNGNAYTFKKDPSVFLLDIYNNDIYPQDKFTKERLDINIPLRTGTAGEEYLSKLEQGLAKIDAGFTCAFVVAGTDVLATDPLGGLRLSLADCRKRDDLVLSRMKALSIPCIFLGGGGYSSESAAAIAQSIIFQASAASGRSSVS